MYLKSYSVFTAVPGGRPFTFLPQLVHFKVKEKDLGSFGQLVLDSITCIYCCNGNKIFFSPNLNAAGIRLVLRLPKRINNEKLSKYHSQWDHLRVYFIQVEQDSNKWDHQG